MKSQNLPIFAAAPDLLDGLVRADLRAAEAARRYARADVVTLGTGACSPFAATGEGLLGLLVLEGMLLRDVVISGRSCAQLLGPGDLIAPEERRRSPICQGVHFTALTTLQIGVLDARFAHVACRWPEVEAALLDRLAQSTQQLAIQLTLTRLPNLEQRLHALLWHLADRWGRCDMQGDAHVMLPLSHETLAKLVSAARPSVTRQLQRLERHDAVRRSDGGWWRVSPPPGFERGPRPGRVPEQHPHAPDPASTID